VALDGAVSWWSWTQGAAALDPLVGAAAAVAAWAARRPDLGAQAYGRCWFSSAPMSASVGAPSLRHLWRRPWWSAACLVGGLRQLVRPDLSPRGAGDGDSARKAPRSGCGGSCAGGVWASGVQAGGAAIFVVVVRLRVGVKV
jgi:hypothetical protein